MRTKWDAGLVPHIRPWVFGVLYSRSSQLGRVQAAGFVAKDTRMFAPVPSAQKAHHHGGRRRGTGGAGRRPGKRVEIRRNEEGAGERGGVTNADHCDMNVLISLQAMVMVLHKLVTKLT